MRKFIITFYLMVGLLITASWAQEYSGKDGKLEVKTIIPQKEEAVYYSVEEIQAHILAIQNDAAKSASEFQAEQDVWIALYDKALEAEIISSKEYDDFINHRLKGEVEGVNWSSMDFIQ